MFVICCEPEFGCHIDLNSCATRRQTEPNAPNNPLYEIPSDTHIYIDEHTLENTPEELHTSIVKVLTVTIGIHKNSQHAVAASSRLPNTISISRISSCADPRNHQHILYDLFINY